MIRNSAIRVPLWIGNCHLCMYGYLKLYFRPVPLQDWKYNLRDPMPTMHSLLYSLLISPFSDYLTWWYHGGLGQFEFELNLPHVPALVTHGEYWPYPVLCQLGFNFVGAARLFTVPGLSSTYLTYPLLRLVWISSYLS